MSQHTYLRIGGPGDVVVFPRTIREVQRVVQTAHEFRVACTVVGTGSNILVRDQGIRGVVIVTTGLRRMRQCGTSVIAEGGVSVSSLALFAAKRGLGGLEFACGIPGTVGGAIRMNAGAFGGQMSDVVNHVVVCTRQGRLRRLDKSELGFDYRDSLISTSGDMVVEATYSLVPSDTEILARKVDAFTRHRRATQPLDYPSCGSVFKRPPGDFAGRLISACGLRGTRIGGAQVSTKHGGFIINADNATASDYLRLIQLIQTEVRRQYGVPLEPEVQIIGDESQVDDDCHPCF